MQIVHSHKYLTIAWGHTWPAGDAVALLSVCPWLTVSYLQNHKYFIKEKKPRKLAVFSPFRIIHCFHRLWLGHQIIEIYRRIKRLFYRHKQEVENIAIKKSHKHYIWNQQGKNIFYVTRSWCGWLVWPRLRHRLNHMIKRWNCNAQYCCCSPALCSLIHNKSI